MLTFRRKDKPLMRIILLAIIVCSSKIVAQIEPDRSYVESVLNMRTNEKITQERDKVFDFFNTNFNLVSFVKNNISIGFNGFMEEDLPDNDLRVTDFFLYDFGINYTLNHLNISLVFENFLNINSTDFSMEPALNNIDTISMLTLEPDASSMINLSVSYTF